jgi:hypothetical protein
MSRLSDTDKRYERYAAGEPETADSIERGRRVLHFEWTEAWNSFGAVRNRARQAQDRARARLREAAASPARTTRTRGAR